MKTLKEVLIDHGVHPDTVGNILSEVRKGETGTPIEDLKPRDVQTLKVDDGFLSNIVIEGCSYDKDEIEKTFSRLGVNPKDAIGDKKVDLSLIPPSAEIALARAFGDGAAKYGPYNWRENNVRARVYVAAAKRHLAQWLDGQENAEDSGVHHLGHVMACCAILIDAQSLGALADDRPKPGVSPKLLKLD